jgi:hypothetical protein
MGLKGLVRDKVANTSNDEKDRWEKPQQDKTCQQPNHTTEAHHHDLIVFDQAGHEVQEVELRTARHSGNKLFIA